MNTRILDGKKTAAAIQAEAREELQALKTQGLVPGLTVVLVGDNPASQVYVRNKIRTCEEVGLKSEAVRLPASTSTEELLEVIRKLNENEEVDGILVQLPLPGQIEEEEILEAIRPDKDVDGLHACNTGRLCQGKPVLAPCTPMGIMEMLRREEIPISGSHAVVIGRSNLVGKPMALLLLHAHATVTVCHSRTRDLAGMCRTADILVAAVGRPALVTREYIKEGAVIVDVGTNVIKEEEEAIRLFGAASPRVIKIREKGYTLIGDVHPRDPLGLASALTPVPGGVGPLTIAHLIKNAVTACRLRRGR